VSPFGDPCSAGFRADSVVDGCEGWQFVGCGCEKKLGELNVGVEFPTFSETHS